MTNEPVTEVRTARLRLVAATAEMVKAAIEDRSRLAAILNASVPVGWPGGDLQEVLPQFHERMRADAAFERWVVWFWILRGDSKRSDVLIGDGGFMGLPDADGRVEIGYSIVPEFRRHGYASEGVMGLLDVAFALPEVATVMAETEKENIASIHVLERLGFCRIVGAGTTARTWFALTRGEYERRTE
jgi:[ribosomal protein S5]-alanine N-acetyltransferase